MTDHHLRSPLGLQVGLRADFETRRQVRAGTYDGAVSTATNSDDSQGDGLLGAGRSAAVIIASTSAARDRKSTRLNSSHVAISYAVFCLKKKNSGKREMAATGENHSREHHGLPDVKPGGRPEQPRGDAIQGRRDSDRQRRRPESTTPVRY